MISFKDKLVFVLVICLACGMVLSGGKVTLVDRNVTDSFRVGENGCMNDTSVCTNHSATCEPSSGLCLCRGSNFRNPVIISDGSLKYGESYGCVSSINIRLGVNTAPCPFAPFQVISYSHHDPVTQFRYDSLDPAEKVASCSLRDAWTKFPDNFTEMKLQMLNESYVNLTFLNNVLHFKWRRSVPELQGTIITFNLRCTLSPLLGVNKCLRAKIFGTWPAGTTTNFLVKTEPTLTSTEQTSSQGTRISTQPTAVITSKPKSTASVKSNDCESENSNVAHKVLYAVLAISLAVNVALGCGMALLWRKLQRIQDKNMNITEMESVDRQQRRNTTDDISPYDEVMVKDGIHNVGADHHTSSPLSGNGNRHGHLTGGYEEEPSNYEPLRRNNLQDDEHNYRSLIKPKERK